MCTGVIPTRKSRMTEGKKKKTKRKKKGKFSCHFVYLCVRIQAYNWCTLGPFLVQGFPLSSILIQSPFHFVPLYPKVTSILVKKEGEWRRQAESNRWQHNRRSLWWATVVLYNIEGAAEEIPCGPEYNICHRRRKAKEKG